MMVMIDDFLFESGTKNKLKALAEIGGLLQLAQFDGEEPSLYHIGGLISSTIEDLFSDLDEFHDLSKQAFKELESRLPADPEALAKEREQSEAFADYLAAKLIEQKPELEKPLKKLLAQNA